MEGNPNLANQRKSSSQLLFLAEPSSFTNWLSALMSSTVRMSSLTCTARPAGKVNNTPTLDEIRLIIPQSTIMGVVDGTLAMYLGKFLDDHLPNPISFGVLIGARPKTQVLDVTHVVQTTVEKAIDSESKGGIAQADIRQFYDTISILRISRWLEREGFPIEWLCAIIRHQLMTTVQVSTLASAQSHVVRNRCIGGLTGSRTAVTVARIPVETTLGRLARNWQQKGFMRKISVSSWVDNLFAIADSCSGAIEMLAEAEKCLWDEWGHTFKPSSLEYMAVWGSEEVLDFAARWRQVTTMKVLGHWISNTGSIDYCFRQTIAAAWRSFWGNLGKPQFRRFTIGLKKSRLSKLVFPLISFRCSRWPWTHTKATRLDAVQRKMLSCLLGLRKGSSETLAGFVSRKNRIISAHIQF